MDSKSFPKDYVALSKAVDDGDIEKVRKLLDEGVHPDALVDFYASCHYWKKLK